MNTDTNLAIEAKAFNKTYLQKNNKNVNALIDFNINVPRGVTFGLLGPNGAGKSTFINILAGLVKKNSGEVKISGLDIDKHSKKTRNLIGIVPQIFLAVSIGSGFEKIIDQNSEIPGISEIIFSPDIYIPLVSFFSLILITIFLRKLFYKN